MIDAACTRHPRPPPEVESRLIGFNVSSVTGGIDALGDVVVQLEADGLKVSGRGVSTDVVEASARAYLAAVNRLVRIRARNERAPGRDRPLSRGIRLAPSGRVVEQSASRPAIHSTGAGAVLKGVQELPHAGRR